MMVLAHHGPPFVFEKIENGSEISWKLPGIFTPGYVLVILRVLP